MNLLYDSKAYSNHRLILVSLRILLQSVSSGTLETATYISPAIKGTIFSCLCEDQMLCQAHRSSWHMGSGLPLVLLHLCGVVNLSDAFNIDWYQGPLGVSYSADII